MTIQMIKTVSTSNPAILKFEFDQFIVEQSYEFSNIDQAKPSLLAQQLFYLPFVKTVYISGNFIAIEKYNIVEWDDVSELVVDQMTDYVNSGRKIITETTPSDMFKLTVNAESSPNPSVMKFVTSRKLVDKLVEYTNADQVIAPSLAQALFNFPFVKEIFLDENYVSITKNDTTDWDDIASGLCDFILEYIEKGNPIISADEKEQIKSKDGASSEEPQVYDETSQKIVDILDEYVKPAVQSDGGNIAFKSFDQDSKLVKVILQGACSGCPSSTMTLKNGIESMLRNMLADNGIQVEAINQ